MKLNKMKGLFVVLLGILLIPFVVVKANSITTRYEVETYGWVLLNYPNDQLYVNYGGLHGHVSVSYESEEARDAGAITEQNKVVEWAKNLGIAEGDINVESNSYTAYYKMVDGTEIWTSNPDEANIIVKRIEISVNAEKNIAKDERTVIDKIEVSGITTDFNDGDKPVYTAKVAQDTMRVESENWMLKAQDHSKIKFNYSNDQFNKDAKASKMYFDKFAAGNVYKHSVVLKVKEPLKYKVTDKTKIYVNGVLYNYNGDFNEIHISKNVLDLASKNVDEKNKVAIEDVVMETIEKATDESHPGISDELWEEIKTSGDISARVDVKKIADEDKASIDDKIKDKVTDDMNIVAYLDITIPVFDGDDQIGYLTKLANNALITVNAPEGLPELPEGYTRTFAAVRLHNGEVVVIEVKVNKDGTLSFESDSFSEYIITYTDTKNKDNKTANPNTLDNISVSFTMLFVSLIGMITLKKFRNN